MTASENYPPFSNFPSQEVPYFTPYHIANPGTPIPSTTCVEKSTAKVPTLFTPLKIRGCTLRNRILVAPMCQYSTAAVGPETGVLTDYHLATLGHYALKGASVVFVEATGVQPNGRITPHCPGLWSDDQIPALRRVSNFIKSQRALCGIQLAHAGRKASTVPPWISAQNGRPSLRATEDLGGWPQNVVGPTGGEAECWDGKGLGPDGGFWAPKQLSSDEIQQMVRDWASSARRAVEAGVDLIEIHAAHGYLISEFLSPVTNRRTDRYGGSFENRVRLLLEIITAIRKEIPTNMPLFVRLSATEWLAGSDVAKQFGSWDLESTIKLAKLLPAVGVDLLDVSSGGNHCKQSTDMFTSKDYQINMAHQIRREMKAAGSELLIGAVGLITEPRQAMDIVETDDVIRAEATVAANMVQGKLNKEPMADCVLIARQFMREPEWVLRAAWNLGVEVAWPSQFHKVKFPKRQ